MCLLRRVTGWRGWCREPFLAVLQHGLKLGLGDAEVHAHRTAFTGDADLRGQSRRFRLFGSAQHGEGTEAHQRLIHLLRRLFIRRGDRERGLESLSVRRSDPQTERLGLT